MIAVEVPATSANLGPGFDVLGLALGLYNRVEAHPSDEVRVEIAGEGEGSLARGASNLVYHAFRRYCEKTGREATPLSLRLTNRIPLARGLGSSSAAIVAGLLVGEALHGVGVESGQLVDWAAELEGHADNVAAALLGGLTVAFQDGGRVGAVSFAPHPSLRALVVIPEERLRTTAARAVLDAQVSREDAVFNIARASLLVGALVTGRAELLREATKDRLHQPARAGLLPHFEAVTQALYEAGADGVALSGAGPSVLALVRDEVEEDAAEETRKLLHDARLGARVLLCGIDSGGGKVVAPHGPRERR